MGTVSDVAGDVGDVRFDVAVAPIEIAAFLLKMDHEFPHPLSSRCDLEDYSRKLVKSGIVESAWVTDRLVGLLAGYVNDSARLEGYISVLVVEPNMRGRKISSTLLERFLSDAQAEGMRTVRVFTYHTNAAALALYRSHGFDEVGLNESGEYELLRIL